MIFTGSRHWGDSRTGVDAEAVIHELRVCANAVSRLISRHVQGVNASFDKKAKASSLAPVGGLVVVQGGAAGADTHVARAAMFMARGLHRRSRDEYARFGQAFTSSDMRSRPLADGLWLETYPADWDNRPRNLAGPERNQHMLDQGADRVIALFAHGRPYGETARGGTNDMVRRAVGAGITVDIYVADERRWRKP